MSKSKAKKSKLTFIKKGHDSFEIVLDEKIVFSVGDNYYTWEDEEEFLFEIIDEPSVLLIKNEIQSFEDRVKNRVIEPNSSNQFVFQNISPLWHCVSDLNLTFRPFEIKNLNDISQEKLNESTDLKKSLEFGTLQQTI